MRNQPSLNSLGEVTNEDLCADHVFAAMYLKAALEQLNDPEHRAAGLLFLCNVAEVYDSLAAVAHETDISREALYCALLLKGKPILKTLIAVFHADGMRLSVTFVEVHV